MIPAIDIYNQAPQLEACIIRHGAVIRTKAHRNGSEGDELGYILFGKEKTLDKH